MPRRHFSEGDRFYLSMQVFNSDSWPHTLDVYILLDVYGSYWSWPGWKPLEEGLDHKTYFLNVYQTKKEDVLDFIWPEVSGHADGLAFIGAAFYSGSWELFGTYQYIPWGY